MQEAPHALPAPPWSPPGHAARIVHAAPSAPHVPARTSPGAPATAAARRRSSRGGTRHGLPRSGTGLQRRHPCGLMRKDIPRGNRGSRPGRISPTRPRSRGPRATGRAQAHSSLPSTPGDTPAAGPRDAAGGPARRFQSRAAQRGPGTGDAAGPGYCPLSGRPCRRASRCGPR
ncbi:MAG: hypothetical protein A4E36_01119 [Methanoregulaceae archaeon PtaB.Bin009]|nr:MAG: hypothetical protein A4E36_01119 [Methanoregulaceae archaeon PtaB.Bin009]